MTTVFPEMVEITCEKSNGERVVIDRFFMSDKMKAKEIIGAWFGDDFKDGLSDSSIILCAFEELLDWQTQQRKAISELIYKKEL